MTFNLFPWRKQKQRYKRQIGIMVVSVSMLMLIIVLIMIPYKQSVTSIHSKPAHVVQPITEPLVLNIKMLGYIEQRGHKQAFVLLPNQALSLIKEGDIVDASQAKVKRIYKNYLMIQLANKKIIFIQNKFSLEK
jgi:hypothetical protein